MIEDSQQNKILKSKYLQLRLLELLLLKALKEKKVPEELIYLWEGIEHLRQEESSKEANVNFIVGSDEYFTKVDSIEEEGDILFKELGIIK